MARRAISLQNVRTRDTIAPPPISLDISQYSYNAREKFLGLRRHRALFLARLIVVARGV